MIHAVYRRREQVIAGLAGNSMPSGICAGGGAGLPQLDLAKPAIIFGQTWLPAFHRFRCCAGRSIMAYDLRSDAMSRDNFSGDPGKEVG
jgi:hypothetical protein